MILTGTNQKLLGSMTFYNLTKVVTAHDTLTFADGSTQTIANGGKITLKGDHGAILSLRTVSNNGVAKFTINNQGDADISFVNVKDGVGTNDIDATYSIDARGNTNWNFVSHLVTSTADTLTTGTLRDALTYALSDQTIYFDMTVFPSLTPNTINVTTALPAISKGNTTIDASLNQGGVIINGSGTPANTDGLVLSSTGNTIKGLTIKSFKRHGISISAGDNIIGGTGAYDGNEIHSNAQHGIEFSADSGQSYILGNYIGTNKAFASLGNAENGIHVDGDGGLLIGGRRQDGTSNIIAFHTKAQAAGIKVINGSITIQGNYIGTNSQGEELVNFIAIFLQKDAGDVTIGGTQEGEGGVVLAIAERF